jgi:peptidoglycan hydrolase-like protein with peptidoglycan-binding domain
MQFGKVLLNSALLLSTALPCYAYTHAHRGPTSPKSFNRRSKTASKSSAQRGIDDTRASQIQDSLIKTGYLKGEASGHWDSQTEAAMQKFQGDNGWQTKLIPDSRAIIKLGLGPNQDASQSSSAGSSSASSFISR